MYQTREAHTHFQQRIRDDQYDCRCLFALLFCNSVREVVVSLNSHVPTEQSDKINPSVAQVQTNKQTEIERKKTGEMKKKEKKEKEKSINRFCLPIKKNTLK